MELKHRPDTTVQCTAIQGVNATHHKTLIAKKRHAYSNERFLISNRLPKIGWYSTPFYFLLKIYTLNILTKYSNVFTCENMCKSECAGRLPRNYIHKVSSTTPGITSFNASQLQCRAGFVLTSIKWTCGNNILSYTICFNVLVTSLNSSTITNTPATVKI